MSKSKEELSMKIRSLFYAIIFVAMGMFTHAEAGPGWGHGGGGGWHGGGGAWHGGGGWHGGYYPHVFVGFGGGPYYYPGYGYYPYYSYGDYAPYYASTAYYPTPNASQAVYTEQPSNSAPQSLTAQVQRTLSAQGYYHGDIDGIIGPLTRSAIAGYQRDHGLDSTGIIDAPTLRAMQL
jgi:hypothetical protein